MIPEFNIVRENNPFKRKMTNEEHCEAYGLFKLGCSQSNIARLYGVNLRTIGLICNSNRRGYRHVYNELHRLGYDAFILRYVNQELIDRYNKLAAENNSAQAQRLAQLDLSSPNIRADKHAGRHVIQTYVFWIKWQEPYSLPDPYGKPRQFKAGWRHAEEYDGREPTDNSEFVGHGPKFDEPWRTSTEAFRAKERDVLELLQQR